MFFYLNYAYVFLQILMITQIMTVYILFNKCLKLYMTVYSKLLVNLFSISQQLLDLLLVNFLYKCINIHILLENKVHSDVIYIFIKKTYFT